MTSKTWQDRLRAINAERKKIDPEELENWIKAAEDTGTRIIAGPRPERIEVDE